MKPNLLDPNEYQKYVDANDHIAKLQNTSEFIDDAVEAMYSQESVRGDQLQFSSLRNKLGFRPGEVTLWAGFNGHGKSLFLGQAMMQMILPNLKKVCFASMEMKPERTLARMTRQYLGDPSPDREEAREYMRTISDYCWFYNVQGVAESRKLIAAMKYAAIDIGVNHFVVDSLMKCGLDEDDNNSQKRFVDQLCTIARDTNMHIHLVAHSRKGKDELTPPGKMDVRGSGTITDQVDNVITIWRNKDLNRPHGEDALMLVDKQRNGEWEGAVSLRFCQSGQSFSETFQGGF